MDNETKSGYVAAGIFLVLGVVILLVGFDSGWQAGKVTIVIGGFMSGFGGLGFWKPEIGKVIAHYLKQISENQEKNNRKSVSYSQKNYKSKNSPQAMTKKGNVTIKYQNFYGSSKKKRY